jgi:2-polyprenyl-3-methyl-5-hydroxy-6-metoxy-1,4-benzoquinol methylase
MRRDPAKEFEKMALINPYYAVLSLPEFRSQSLDEQTKLKFWQTGHDHVETVFSIIKRHLVPEFRPSHALDFGCGVGRVLIPLAAKCGKVVGLDSSESMLVEAEQNCRAAQLTNFELAVTDQSIGAPAGTYDFIHSALVFQHIPRPKGEQLLKHLLDLLAPEGVAMLQLPFKESRPLLMRIDNWARRALPLYHGCWNLLRGRAWQHPFGVFRFYNLSEVFSLAFESNCTRCFIAADEHAHALLFFQKSKSQR